MSDLCYLIWGRCLGFQFPHYTIAGLIYKVNIM